MERKEAPADIGAVLVSPLPEKGFKVAEIGGYDYYFDHHYLFKLNASTFTVAPKKKWVEDVILTELMAVEAKKHELTPDPGSVESYMLMQRGERERLEEQLAMLEEGKEHWADFPADNRQKLKKSLETTKTRLEKINALIAEILQEENITEEEFFEQLRPYAEKQALADARKEVLSEEAGEEVMTDVVQYQGWLNDIKAQLWEEYDVKITY